MHLQDTWPDKDDLDGWEKAARKAALRAKQMKQEIGSGYHRGSKSVQENCYLTFIAPTKKDKNGGRQRIKRDPNAMEVDTAEIGKTSFKRMDPKEMQRLKSEGRCFHCKQQGHMSCQCPKKSDAQ